MRERPIIFSGPMVLAILGGRKTMTRRVVKNHPLIDAGFTTEFVNDPGNASLCPYGQPGDRLWVRETYFSYPFIGHDGKETECTVFRADGEDYDCKGDEDRWRPSIFMPRWASRITLEITAVKVERIQDMNFYDWVADFCPSPLEQERALETFVGMKNMAEMAKTFWDSLNAKRGYGWDANPWVWVIEFKRVTP